MTTNSLYGICPIEMMETSTERSELTNVEQHTSLYETDTKKMYVYETKNESVKTMFDRYGVKYEED